MAKILGNSRCSPSVQFADELKVTRIIRDCPSFVINEHYCCVLLLFTETDFGKVQFLVTGWTAPWWLEIPSIITFYGLFYGFFDKWLWKRQIFRKLGLVSIPNLNGTWKGYVKSSHDGFKEELEASIKILQTWTQIGIFQETKTSKGFSFSASLHTKNLDGIRLFFMYRNMPESDADPNMHQHLGSAQLVLSSDEKILSGDYCNCIRDRPTYGKIRYERS